MATERIQIEGQVGPLVPQSDGNKQAYPRYGKTGELIVSAGLPKYYELVSRGMCYMSSNQAEVTFGTALTATAVTHTIYNPQGSSVNVVLLQCATTIRTCSTPGHLVYAANVNNNAVAPATNTELIIRNAKLDLSAGYAKAYSATTLPAAPVAVRSFGATITAAGVAPMIDYIDGAIILGPNTAITVQGITVVGTGIISFFWAEIPI